MQTRVVESTCNRTISLRSKHITAITTGEGRERKIDQGPGTPEGTISKVQVTRGPCRS